jgi:hypothetical protein
VPVGDKEDQERYKTYERYMSYAKSAKEASEKATSVAEALKLRDRAEYWQRTASLLFV